MVIEKVGMSEGVYMNKYIKGRFDKNKNILLVITGSTGSGKTYSGLKLCENWYNFYFNKSFPVENVCFSLEEVARRLKDRTLNRYELLMLEEAGANLGASDYQTKISKIFTYILQSFRSMNIGLVMTLPVLTMLNKQGRQLLHVHFTTEGISGGKCKLKVKIHQLNQQSGKSYWKAPIIKHANGRRKMPYIFYSLASVELRDAYEQKKESFVYKLVDNFEENIKTKEQKNMDARLREREVLRVKEEYLRTRKGANNRIKCLECGTARVDIQGRAIVCRTCGHVEDIPFDKLAPTLVLGGKRGRTQNLISVDLEEKKL